VQFYLPIAELPVDVLMLLGMGAAVGFISGMFGVGGGFLMTPLLIFVGIPPAVAVATQSAQIVASSTTSALNYWRRRQIDVKLGLVLLIGALAGTFLGIAFFNNMRRVGQLDTVISLSYISLLGSVGLSMLTESLRALFTKNGGAGRSVRRAGQHAWYEGLPLKMRFPRSGIYVSLIPLTVLSVFIGFAGAVLGIGGGFILVPALIYIFRMPAAIVVGTSQVQILGAMTFATMMHAGTNHSVDLPLAVMLTLGGVFGAQFGARAGMRLRGEHFRLLLAVLICAVAARFAFDVFMTPSERYSVTLTDTPR
jgi:hypothetical protein